MLYSSQQVCSSLRNGCLLPSGIIDCAKHPCLRGCWENQNAQAEHCLVASPRAKRRCPPTERRRPVAPPRLAASWLGMVWCALFHGDPSNTWGINAIRVWRGVYFCVSVCYTYLRDLGISWHSAQNNKKRIHLGHFLDEHFWNKALRSWIEGHHHGLFIAQFGSDSLQLSHFTQCMKCPTLHTPLRTLGRTKILLGGLKSLGSGSHVALNFYQRQHAWSIKIERSKWCLILDLKI